MTLKTSHRYNYTNTQSLSTDHWSIVSRQVTVYLVYVWLKNSFHQKAVLFWGVVIMIGVLHFAAV